MRTGIVAIATSAMLMLSAACGPLSGEEPAAYPTAEPDSPATPTPSPTPTQAQSDEAKSKKIHDDLLAEVGEEVPGFGGLFLDSRDNSIVYVYMLDPSQQEEAERAAKSMMDSTSWERTREVRVLQGQYSMTQLKEWYDRMRDVLIWSIPELVLTDLDEGENRIEIGVDHLGVQGAIEEELDRLDIPREAVIIRVRQRPTPAVLPLPSTATPHLTPTEAQGTDISELSLTHEQITWRTSDGADRSLELGEVEASYPSIFEPGVSRFIRADVSPSGRLIAFIVGPFVGGTAGSGWHLGLAGADGTLVGFYSAPTQPSCYIHDLVWRPDEQGVVVEPAGCGGQGRLVLLGQDARVAFDVPT